MFNAQGFELVFWVAALGGTLFFVLRVVMGLTGMDFHAHDTGGVGAHSDFAHDAQGTFDAFKVFSLYSIAAFIMMFGWVGLAATKEMHLGHFAATLLAIVVGVGTMILTAYFFYTTRKLESTGTVFSLDALKGKRCSVYQRIPQGGRGVIHVTQEGILREIEAINEGLGDLDSFAEVQIVGALDEKTAIVKKV